MSGADSNWMRDGLDGVVRRLRDERPQLEPLELDRMKTRVLARGSTRTTKGAAMRRRIAVAVLSLGLMGAGAGGVLAGSSGSSNGASSASAQYHPHHHHKCPNGFHRDHDTTPDKDHDGAHPGCIRDGSHD